MRIDSWMVGWIFAEGGGVGPADGSTGSVAFTNNFYFLQNRYKMHARNYAAIQL